MPERILSFIKEVGATRLFANIEYAVDELRRDIKVCELAKEANVGVQFLHDKLIIEPGKLFTKQGKPYTVRENHAMIFSNLMPLRTGLFAFPEAMDPSSQ